MPCPKSKVYLVNGLFPLLNFSPLIVGTVKIWDLRMRNLQCQRIFQAGNIVNSVKLHPNQQEVLVGDAAGKYILVSACKLDN